MSRVLICGVVAVTVTVILLVIGLPFMFMPYLDLNDVLQLNYDLQLWPIWMQPNQNKCKLTIGILSGRDNEQRRTKIRQTWLSPDYGPDICIKFVVGSEECAIPPEDRIDIYGCEPWLVKDPVPGTHFMTETNNDDSSCDFGNKLNVGIRLKVRHPIVIDKLGILNDVLLLNEVVNVYLLATDTQEVVAWASFTADRQGNLQSGFSYRPVESIYLPKDYEATIVCSGPTTADPIKWNRNFCCGVNYDLGGNVIIAHQVFDTDGVSRGDVTNGHLAVSFAYTIYDMESLMRHLTSAPDRLHQWLAQSRMRSEVLHTEAIINRDVVLVEMVDTYRDLPRKLLLFYTWVTENLMDAEHVIKMDDDSVIDVTRISKLLKSTPTFLDCDIFWWGRFRHHWSVQQHGKWLERDYNAGTYPLFACGVASLLTTNVVRWLANNREQLRSYQGEDVSMGIWLAAIKPIIIEDDRWQCNENCDSNSLSRGQLDVNGIEETWRSLQACGRLCECFEQFKESR